VRWLDTAFDGAARRAAHSPIDGQVGGFKDDESSLIIKGGVEPPHSKTSLIVHGLLSALISQHLTESFPLSTFL